MVILSGLFRLLLLFEPLNLLFHVYRLSFQILELMRQAGNLAVLALLMRIETPGAMAAAEALASVTHSRMPIMAMVMAWTAFTTHMITSFLLGINHPSKSFWRDQFTIRKY
jgi:hypothetical protein